MLCSVCHKNEAVICYTEIINGEKTEKYLCPECAARYTSFEMGESAGSSPDAILAGLLASVLGQTGQTAVLDDEAKKTNLVCKTCGMTYNEFLKYSKFGCPDCVHTFAFLLDDYLRKIQGSCEHLGKQYQGRETVTLPKITLMEDESDGIHQPRMAGASDPARTRETAQTAAADGQKSSLANGKSTDSMPAGSKEIDPNEAISEEPSEIALLKMRLAKAVEEEEFEEAARLRDEIRERTRADRAGAAPESVRADHTEPEIVDKEAGTDEHMV